MHNLDLLIPAPRLLERDEATVAAAPELVWERLRHGDLGQAGPIRALFWLRTLPTRAAHKAKLPELRVDNLRSSKENPGFQVLFDEPPRTFGVGAIGKVWQSEIPFVHVSDAAAFARFDEPDYVKVAWAITIEPEGAGSRVLLELRVDATDDDAYRHFKRYFALIGPGSRFIRHALLRDLERSFAPEQPDPELTSLPGDELLPDATVQMTHSIRIAASAEKIWPWLVQMGCHRAGFYSVDLLDNRGKRSARELHPEWQSLAVGQVVAATPTSEDGFEVLQVDAPHHLVLGGLYDTEGDMQLRFSSPRPEDFWHVTWSFVLLPIDADHTELQVRVRGKNAASNWLRAAAMKPVHHLMQTAQLRHLAARAEERLPRDDAQDVLDGVGGAAMIAFHLLTPFLRGQRSSWGVDETIAHSTFPGDELVPQPMWSWTHGIEIAAPARKVWPWIAQIGCDRGGFYSYQWLENLAGCKLRNAETVHPEWELAQGSELRIHPKQPPLVVSTVERGRYFVAHAPESSAARTEGEPWVAVSWGFYLEPINSHHCRLISRYRAASSRDLATRLSFGPMLLEPIGFAMDRRMLFGIKQRSEQAATSLSEAAHSA